MAVVAWPTAFGSPNLDGFQFTETALVERQESHRGQPRLRRRVNSRPTTIDLTFWFDLARGEQFERFYWDDLVGGANQVNMRITTIFGPLNVIMTFYPYSVRYDTIMAAAEYRWTAYYNAPPITLFAAMGG